MSGLSVSQGASLYPGLYFSRPRRLPHVPLTPTRSWLLAILPLLRLCALQLADFGLRRVLDVDKKTHVSTQTYETLGAVSFCLRVLLYAAYRGILS